MRTALTLTVMLVACRLDLASKPECLDDTDCHWSEYDGRRQCVASACVVNAPPIAERDVFYVRDGVAFVEGDVLANDHDPDGDPLARLVDYTTTGDSIVSIEVASQLPSWHTYTVVDTTSDQRVTGSIIVTELPATITLPVYRGSTISLHDALAEVIVMPESLSVLTPPSAGVLTGEGLVTTYAAPADSCTPVSTTLMLGAANGMFEITVIFDIQLELHDEAVAVDVPGPHTVDVLANDGVAPLTITAAQPKSPTSAVSIAPDGRALVVEPRLDALETYEVEYTAEDASGCIGTATATIKSVFPTRLYASNSFGVHYDPVSSNDGRYVAFASTSATLVSGDTNGTTDVFVLDAESGAIERVSVASDGSEANGASGAPSISADGRFVAFHSSANNLDAADTTPVYDIYLHDRVTGTTALVSVGTGGGGSTQASWMPHISADGSRVAFASAATQLVVGDTNNASDVFVRDLSVPSTTRVSVTESGAQSQYGAEDDVAPRISGDGRYVAFASLSPLDDQALGGGTFLVDTLGGAIERLGGAGTSVDLDHDGRHVAYTTTGVHHYDRLTKEDTDVGPGGWMPSISADGRFLSYKLSPTTVCQAVQGPPIDAAVLSDGSSASVLPDRRPEISGDGRWIVFVSYYWPGYFQKSVIVRVWNRAYTP